MDGHTAGLEGLYEIYWYLSIRIGVVQISFFMSCKVDPQITKKKMIKIKKEIQGTWYICSIKCT